MRDKNKNFVCDYCQGVEGNFYTDTGNHVACQQAAEKDAELLALRERVAKLEKQLKDAQKVSVYFSKLGHGVRPSLGAMRLVRAYESALKSQ